MVKHFRNRSISSMVAVAVACATVLLPSVVAVNSASATVVTKVIRKITAGLSAPTNVASDANHVWAVDYTAKALVEMSNTTGEVVKTISLAAYPTGICDDGTNVWVSVANRTVVKVSASTGNVVSTTTLTNINIPTWTDLQGGITSDGTNVWVDDVIGGYLYRLNASTGALVQSITTTQRLGYFNDSVGLIYSDGVHLWVSGQYTDYGSGVSGDPQLLEYNASNGTLVRSIAITWPSSSKPFSLNGVYSDGTTVWLATAAQRNRTGRGIVKIDASTGSILDRYSMSDTLPGAYGITVDSNYIWVTESEYSYAQSDFASVAKFDKATGAFLGSYYVGPGLAGGLVSDGTYVWIANGVNVVQLGINVNVYAATNTVAPVLTDTTTAGAFTVGDVISTSDGTWTNSTGTYTYKWYTCTSNSVSTPATSSSCFPKTGSLSTITLSSQDLGKYLFAVVTATGTDDTTTSATSTPLSSAISNPPGGGTRGPTLSDTTTSGAFVSGDTVTGNTSQWLPNGYTVGMTMWFRCNSNSVADPTSDPACSPIMTASGLTYTLTSSDVNKYLWLTAMATGSGAPLSGYSNWTPKIAAGSGGGGGGGSLTVCATQSYAVCDATYTYSSWTKVTVTWSAPSAYPPGAVLGYKVYNATNPSQVFCSTSTSVQSCEVTVTSSGMAVSIAPILTGNSPGPATPVMIQQASFPQILGFVGSTGLQLAPNMYSTMNSWILSYTVNGHTCTETFTGGTMAPPVFSDDCAPWTPVDRLVVANTAPAESGWLSPSTSYQVTGTFSTSIVSYSMSGQTTTDITLPVAFSFTTLSAPQAAPSEVSFTSNGDGTYTVKWKVPVGVDGQSTGTISSDQNYSCQAPPTLSNGFWSCIVDTQASSPPAPTDFYVFLAVDRFSLLSAINPPAGQYSNAGGIFARFDSYAWANSNGTSSTPVIPVAPGSVTSAASSAGNGSVTVTWSAPTSGDAPTSYEVSIPGRTTCVINLVTTPNAALSCTFTGLTNGTNYTATVVAKNAAGTSTGATTSATPVAPTPPGAPTGVSATAGNGQATISWTAPASAGSSAITSYTVTSSPSGLTCTVNAPATSCTISGLTNGTGYTFTVVATSSAGNSSPSSASTSVSPQATVPSAPTNVTAASGDGQATISWTTPSSDGGASIDGYIVTASPGGLTCTAVAPDTTCTITGLTNGTSYTFTVVASNNIGASDPSSASNSVTPAAGPSAPDRAQVTPGNHSATINWKAPVDGAAPIRYVVTMNPGGRTCTVDLVAHPNAALSCTFTGLTNGVNYSFTIAAFTANGMSASDTVFATPGAAPTKPSAPRGVKFRGSVTGIGTVTWKVSGSNGGSPITKYVVLVTGTRYAKSCVVNMVTNPNATLSCSVSGLKPKRFYNFRVKAVNAVGEALSPKARQAIDTVIRVVSFGVGKTTMWSGLYRQAFITAGYIKKFKYTKVTLTGYTNPGGTLAGRTRFTQLRALTVANYFTRQLRAMGVRNVTVIAVGTGASIYKGPSLTPLQRKKNRSVTTLLSYK